MKHLNNKSLKNKSLKNKSLKNKSLKNKSLKNKSLKNKSLKHRKSGGFLIGNFSDSISKTQSPACSQYTSDNSGCSQYSKTLEIQKQTQSDSQYDINPIPISNNDKPSLNSSCSGVSGGIVGCSSAQQKNNQDSYNSSLSETTGRRTC